MRHSLHLFLWLLISCAGNQQYAQTGQQPTEASTAFDSSLGDVKTEMKERMEALQELYSLRLSELAQDADTTELEHWYRVEQRMLCREARRKGLRAESCDPIIGVPPAEGKSATIPELRE